MEYRNFWFKNRSDRAYAAIVILLILVLAWLNPIVAGLCTLVAFGVYLVLRKTEIEQERVWRHYLNAVSASVTEASLYATQNLPIGIAIIDEKSMLVWSNSVFRDWGQELKEGDRLQKLLPQTQLAKLWGKSGYFSARIGDSYYRVIYKFLDRASGINAAENDNPGEAYMVLYFDDVTEAERSKQESVAALPVFCYVQLDNLGEVSSDLTEVQRSALWAEVNTMVLDEFGKIDGFIKSYERNNYIACISRKSLQQLIDDNFKILEKVRSIHTVNRIPVTLSIGCAYGEESFAEQEGEARLALDLALGRGGDQVVIRADGETQTFGGRSQALAKNTRVRARVVAQAIHELISQADMVLVMGHAREDYDSLGAAVGVAYMATSEGVPAHVVISEDQETVEKLVDQVWATPGMEDLLISEEAAQELVTPQTVLFVVDTHKPEMTAAPSLVEMIQNRVVIDHHRRSNTFIPDPLLVYLEPSSSSTCELVTELLQYYSDTIELNETQASALYAGIVVDTKNFAVQTGIRTFDAASYLRRSGAATELVRDLFALDFETVLTRADVLTRAEKIDGDIVCATIPDDAENAQILAGQVADMMINIENIHTSIAIYYNGEGYSASVRSDGEINVQRVMEELGGGGHQTVAGGQFAPEETPEEIKNKIVAQIRAQKEENAK